MLRSGIFFIIIFVLCGVLFAQIDAGLDQQFCPPNSVEFDATVTGVPGTLNYTFSFIPYAPEPYIGIDIFSTITSKDDGYSGALPIGFQFCFLGNVYTNFYASVNGWIGFDPPDVKWTHNPATIPNTNVLTPKNCIMGPYMDFDIGTGGKVVYNTTGIAPNRKLVVSFIDVPIYQASGQNCNNFKAIFQIVLYETTNVVENFIETKPICPGASNGSILATQGVHGPNGLIAYTVPGRNSTQWTASNEGVRFDPSGITWYDGVTLVGYGTKLKIAPTTTTTYTANVTLCDGSTYSDNVDAIQQCVCDTQEIIIKQPSCFGEKDGYAIVKPKNSPQSFPPWDYNWKDQNGTIFRTLTNQTLPDTIKNIGAGGFAAIVKDSKGCLVSVRFTVRNPSFFDIVPAITDASCFGVCDGQVSLNVSGSVPPYNYTWSDGKTGSSLTNVCAANYTITIKDANNCDTTVLIAIGQPQEVSATVSGKDSVCAGSSTTLTANAVGANPPFIYTWIGQSVTTNNTTVTPFAKTIYSVFATDSKGCKSPTLAKTVNVYSQPSVSITPSNATICSGDSILVKATPFGGNGTYFYSWSNGVTTNSFYAKPPSTSTFIVSITDGCSGVPANKLVNITVGNYPSVLFYAETSKACAPHSVRFVANNFNPLYNYHWTFGDGVSFSSTNDSVNYTYTTSGCHDVSLSVTSTQNCKSTQTYPCMAETWALPNANILVHPKNPSNITPLVNLIDQSDSALSWSWNIEGVIQSEEQNWSHQFQDTGIYAVRLAIKDKNGCVDTAYTTINVDYETTLYVPNTFTPNDDLKNDMFGPIGIGLREDGYEMQIYGRTGQLVFKTNKLSEPWTGNYKNGTKIMPQGTYVWKIIYLTPQGAEKIIHGYVTLL